MGIVAVNISPIMILSIQQKIALCLNNSINHIAVYGFTAGPCLYWGVTNILQIVATATPDFLELMCLLKDPKFGHFCSRATHLLSSLHIIHLLSSIRSCPFATANFVVYLYLFIVYFNPLFLLPCMCDSSCIYIDSL